MSVDSPARLDWRRRLALHGEDYALLGMIALVFGFALAGAFTHMHDWTITSTNEALAAYAKRRGLAEAATVPDWIGWANAVTSEIMPTASLLYLRKYQRYGRSIAGPVVLFIGSLLISLAGQLAAVGVRAPHDALFLACLPVIALTTLAVLKIADLGFAREAAEAAELAAAKQRKIDADAAAQAARDAELLAEQRAELRRREAREAAELQARLDREEREHAAALELRRVEVEQAGVTERARIEAEERQRDAARRAEVDADERRRRHAAEVEAARVRAAGEAEATRIKAEADARLVAAQAAEGEAAAEAKRVAAAALAQATGPADHEGGDSTAPGRVRRSAEETQALVDAVLDTLGDGTTRDVAVKRVAASLSVSAEYARRFVPAGWIKGGSSAGAPAEPVDVPAQRHLVAVGGRG